MSRQVANNNPFIVKQNVTTAGSPQALAQAAGMSGSKSYDNIFSQGANAGWQQGFTQTSQQVGPTTTTTTVTKKTYQSGVQGPTTFQQQVTTTKQGVPSAAFGAGVRQLQQGGAGAAYQASAYKSSSSAYRVQGPTVTTSYQTRGPTQSYQYFQSSSTSTQPGKMVSYQTQVRK